MEIQQVRCQVLFECIWVGTLPNLVFSDENNFDVQQHFNSQSNWIWSQTGDSKPQTVTWRQGLASVIVWTVVTATGKSLLIYAERWVKSNQENYVKYILESSLLLWAFKNWCWLFQLDSEPSHGTKKTLEWLATHVPHFTPKEEWPPSSPYLNPLHYSI